MKKFKHKEPNKLALVAHLTRVGYSEEFIQKYALCTIDLYGICRKGEVVKKRRNKSGRV